jgi:small subunit ribosomal protein S1
MSESEIVTSPAAEAPEPLAAQPPLDPPVAPEPAAPVAEEVSAESSPAGAAKPKAPKAGKSGERSARARARAKSARERAQRAEEFVAPTPEELAGIPSDIVRVAVEAGGPVAGKIIGWNQGGFHAAVDGISAFCPRSSMELGPPHEPAHYLDQEYLFRVLRVEEKGRRLILSRAAVLREERRHQLEEKRKALEIGQVVRCKVVSLAEFGAFVDLGGIEGLIHVSELRRRRVAHPKEVLEVGQEIEAKIVKLPQKGERVSLSLRALEPDPWAGAEEKWPPGGRFSGTIARKSEFGWFVELAPGVEGLLHPSQLPPGVKESDPSLAPGARVEGWVRELDLERKRVSLALREVPAGDPWKEAWKKYAEGQVVAGKIEKLAPFGAFVALEPGITGLLPTSEMGLPRGAAVGKAYPLGREVKLKVAEFDARRKRISLTRVDKTLEGSKADFQAYLKQSRKASGMGTLAAAFARLKS